MLLLGAASLSLSAPGSTRTVGDVPTLLAAIDDRTISRVLCSAAGSPYTLPQTLQITRDVTVEAEAAGAVVLDAAASPTNPRRVVEVVGATVTLVGLTVTGGWWSAPKFCISSNGAGIFNQGELTLINVSVHGNTASSGWCGPEAGTAGGGVFSDGPLTLLNVDIYNNTAFGYGGPYSTGMAQGGGVATSSTLRMTDSRVHSNAAHGAGGGFGGGVFCSGKASIQRTTVYGNTASAYGGRRGGGIFNDGEMSLEASTVVNNSARVVLGSDPTTGGGGGGGVGNDGTLTVRDTLIAHNVAADWGGGVESSATATLANVSVLFNGAAKGDDSNYGISNTGTLNQDGCHVANNTHIDGRATTVDLSHRAAAPRQPAGALSAARRRV